MKKLGILFGIFADGSVELGLFVPGGQDKPVRDVGHLQKKQPAEVDEVFVVSDSVGKLPFI